MSGRPDLRLVGDVGGTNARFALADLSGAEPRLLDPRSFARSEFPSLEAAIAGYLDGASERPASAVIAVAGPVTDGAAALTNGEWRMSEQGLLKNGFDAARLINDFTALALSVRRLGPDDLADVGEASPSLTGAVAVIGAGTGLGVAAVVREDGREAVVVTEGGHIAFAPADDIEIEVLRHLSGRFGRVSLERILSGSGLVNLRWALGKVDGLEVQPLEPEQIVDLAMRGENSLCVQTLDRFCAIYGAAAGDFALAFGATGGVYLGGGISPRILEPLRRSAFRARFEAKGRFAAYTTRIATRVILHPMAALLGAADAPMDAR